MAAIESQMLLGIYSLGGNGLLPVPNACSPTLTNIAVAIHSSAQILTHF